MYGFIFLLVTFLPLIGFAADDQMLAVKAKLESTNPEIWMPMCEAGTLFQTTARSYSGIWCKDQDFGQLVIKKCGLRPGFTDSKCFLNLSPKSQVELLNRIAALKSDKGQKDLLGGNTFADLLSGRNAIMIQSSFRRDLENNNKINFPPMYLSKYAMAEVQKDDANTIVIPISGLATLTEVLSIGGNILPSEDKSFTFGGGFAHKGFKKEYEIIWPDLYSALQKYAKEKNRSLDSFTYRVSGHSGGGALAVLIAMRIAKEIFKVTPDLANLNAVQNKIKVITYNMPRMLSEKAANYYNCLLGRNTVRAYVKGDTVPERTPSFYHHVGEPLYLDIDVDDPHNDIFKIFSSLRDQRYQKAKQSFDDAVKSPKVDTLRACTAL